MYNTKTGYWMTGKPPGTLKKNMFDIGQDRVSVKDRYTWSLPLLEPTNTK